MALNPHLDAAPSGLHRSVPESTCCSASLNKLCQFTEYSCLHDLKRNLHVDTTSTSVQFVVCVPQNQEAPSGLDLVRCIATARIVMPRTVVRLSAGRLDLSAAEQALAFMAGANSIFDGDKLLTTANNDRYVA